MSGRAQILSFLRDVSAFRGTAGDADTWLAALDAFAAPTLAAAGEHPLRPAQVAAWRGLAGERAGLVLGPPGTGKTHVLAWLILGYIEARRAQGLPTRVFVSAFTRNAIGNLLDAVATLAKRHGTGDIAAYFLGSAPPAGLSEHVVHRERVSAAEGRSVIADLRGDIVVAGASIWTLSKLMAMPQAAGDGFTADLFDLVCIDEASQMVLGHGLMAMAGLGPGGRLVVAGDDRQLPPIRAGREVRIGDLEVGGSLYGFMKSAAFAEFALDETFRLNGPLAGFPERKFYAGRYRSAVEERRLSLAADWRDGLSAWQVAVLDPEWPVVVLLHEGRSAATSNPFEADLAAEVCRLLAERFTGDRTDAGIAADLWRERLAAISLHRAQNGLIRKALTPALRERAFIETVDRIQGKERDAVVLSYCVADPEFALAEADFIFSPERLNVAVTRARSKLVMIASRRLLDAAPGDQEQMDKAEVLREFVFAASPIATFARDDDGRTAAFQVRVVGFGGAVPATEPETPDPIVVSVEPVIMTRDLEDLEAAVRAVAIASRFGTATIPDIRRRLAGRKDLLPGLGRLQDAGRIRMEERTGSRGVFLVARPLDPTQPPFGVDEVSVSQRIEEVIRQSRRGGLAPFYTIVRHRFAWMDGEGGDALHPQVDRLAAAGVVILGAVNGSLTVDWRERDEAPPDEGVAEAATPSDDDFMVLNALEDMEAARINFGVFEAWTSAAAIADANAMSRDRVASALGRLAVDGWLMFAAEGRVRSRMAELAREIRYVKQRFKREDAGERPYLVRSLKLVLRNRDKPGQTEPVAGVFEAAGAALSNHARTAASGVASALQDLWGPDAALAGFQARSLQTIMPAWFEGSAGSFVIAADTGSGKTEAACLPLIVGAAADRLAGIKGVRAVLAYPRVRLATNQAQRLARYLAALALRPGMPTLTLGLQIAAVPQRFDALEERETAAGWASLGQHRFAFPFFACPACTADLMLLEDGGADAADRLDCTDCGWSFSGWIGSKAKLAAMPPALFVPTTDSLHQWMHNERYGRLFGDDAAFAPPRAVLADEIHLYAHVHGAQVGLTLRRLAARAEGQRPADADDRHERHARRSSGGVVAAFGAFLRSGARASTRGARAALEGSRILLLRAAGDRVARQGHRRRLDDDPDPHVPHARDAATHG